MEPLRGEDRTDDSGAPDGGWVEGVGLSIRWQRGPLGRGTDRRQPNGAFVETVLQVARKRLEHYQLTRFRCPENAEAIEDIDAALEALRRRTERREREGTEGTHGGGAAHD